MQRRRFLLGAGAGVALVLTGCGSEGGGDRASTDDSGSGGDESSTSATGAVETGATEDDADLIEAAIGTWTAVNTRADLTVDFDIRADGTFTWREDDFEADGTWELDDGELTIELVVPGGPDVGGVYRCVLEGASLDATEMEMTSYTVDGEDSLYGEERSVAVALEGERVVIDEVWQAAPEGSDDAGSETGDAADEELAAALLGTWVIDSSGRGGVFCSDLEPEISAFRTITFDDGEFEGELICGGRSRGLGSDTELGATFPEVVTGSWRVEGGAVVFDDLSGDGEPLDDAAAAWAADNPQPVEVDGDEMFAGALDESRTRYVRD